MPQFLSVRWRRSTSRDVLFTIAPLLAGALCLSRGPEAFAASGEPPPTRQASTPTAQTIVSDRANPISAGMQANTLESTNLLRSFLARGVIKDIPAGGQTLLVRHEEIPGYMPKMTMEFNVRDAQELRGLQAGDAITFQVKANENESWIEGIQRARATDPHPPTPLEPSSASLLNIAKLKTGEVLPDAELLSERGNPIHLSDFRGNALALTFIFTRCPLPDFCPRMNQHFARTRELLLQRPDGPTNWQFLTISFDPEFDKPGVLNRYAFSYRGANSNRWLFASAPTNVLASLVPQLDFRFANEGGSFIHNLRTVVLDTQGRLQKQFEGNKWKPADLADSLIQAARNGESP